VASGGAGNGAEAEARDGGGRIRTNLRGEGLNRPRGSESRSRKTRTPGWILGRDRLKPPAPPQFDLCAAAEASATLGRAVPSAG